MQLTSYERLRRYIGDESAIGGLTDSAINKRLLLTWIYSISDRVEQYLKRSIELTSRTKYFDIGYAQKEFWVMGVPISTITSVKADSTGLFGGDETTLDTDDDYHIGTEESSVVLLSNSYSSTNTVNRGLQIVYTGGLAESATRSIFVVASVTGWVVNHFCIGSTSNSVGIVRAVGAASLTVEVLYGVFEAAETITAHTSEDGSDVAVATTTITSKSQTALCESYPAIVGAVEGEIRYMWKHKEDFENNASQKDGTTLRRAADARPSLQLETKLLLEPYINATL